MGTDNLFHKRRKAKSAKQLKRGQPKRAAYEKILIVCEGEKTEPYYFAGARNYYGLSTVNVEVRGESGSDPLSVVNFARQRYREEKDAGDAFDKVYCVFDRDSHSTFTQALSVLAATTPKETFFAIPSIPSFEYWILLHFDYTAQPYTATPDSSAGRQVLRALKRYMPHYEKGLGTVFEDLIEQLDFAISNARRVLAESERTGSDNPSTRVHELVCCLRDLKK